MVFLLLLRILIVADDQYLRCTATTCILITFVLYLDFIICLINLCYIKLSWLVLFFDLRWCTWARACVVSGRWQASPLRAPVVWGTRWVWWELQGASLPHWVPSNPHQSCCLRCLWPWPLEEHWVGSFLFLEDLRLKWTWCHDRRKLLGWKNCLLWQRYHSSLPNLVLEQIPLLSTT